MNAEAGYFVKQIAWYVIFWFVFASGLFFFLRWRAEKLYSADDYEKMVATVSDSRLPAADPCQFFIWGDPPNAEGNFAKAIFYCAPDKKAVNSLDLSVLPTANYKEMLTEVSRINGFSVEPLVNGKDWQCFADRKRIIDFETKIKLRSRVECFYRFSQAEINKVYAEN